MRTALTAIEVTIGSALLIGFVAFALQGVAGFVQLVL